METVPMLAVNDAEGAENALSCSRVWHNAHDTHREVHEAISSIVVSPWDVVGAPEVNNRNTGVLRGC